MENKAAIKLIDKILANLDKTGINTDKLIDDISRGFKQHINHYIELTEIPSHQHVDQLIKEYVDNRKLHDLESKLPELKGIFSDL